MNKIKLLFDASLLSEYHKKNSRRTGVYFVEYNLFNRFINSDNFDILLYCRPNCIIDLKKTLESDKYKDYKLQILNDEGGLSRILEEFWNNTEEQAKKNRIIKIIRNRVNRLLNYINTKKLDRRIKENGINAYFSSETIEIPRPVFENKDLDIFVFINDVIPLIFPEYFEGAKKGMMHPVAKAVDQFNRRSKGMYGIANSEYSREDFLKFTPDEMGENVTVAHLACGDRFTKCCDREHIESVKRKYTIPENAKYVLSLCTLEPRKNLTRVIESFVGFIKKNEIDDIVLVLCGSNWEEFFNKLERSIEDIGYYKDRIIITGYVDDEDVPILYSDAEWFVYTSQYEGFGLPPLEAMSCGCPVITSNNTSLPEVVGDAGIMIDYDSIDQHIEAYEKMYYDSDFRSKCIEKGLIQSKKFNWDKCYEIIENFILNNTKDQE